jgi:hypothetical protein
VYRSSGAISITKLFREETVMTDNLFIAHDNRVFETLVGKIIGTTKVAEEDLATGELYDDVKRKWLKDCRGHVKEAANLLTLASSLFAV